METLDTLRNLWFVLIGVLFLGYSILDGFDLGIGTLFPFLAKNEEDKNILIRTIGPFWDGNEVWILTGGGALFAAFPHAYATVFSGLYLALMLVLFSLIFRAVSLEFRAHDPKRKGFWEGAFVAGSFLPSLLFGVALGNMIQGVPLNEQMEFTGSFFTLLRPFPLAVGLLGLTAILLQGSTFAAVKVSGDLLEKARQTSRLLIIPFICLSIIVLILTVLTVPGAAGKLLAWVFTAVMAASLMSMRFSIGKGKDKLVFFLSSLNFFCLWGIVGAVHFPNLVRAGNNPSLSITISNASSSLLTLKVMLIIALIGMPIVIGYTFYLYKVFKGKVREEKEAY
jgi:cytochrome d ubiquinol oxidase subunit II